MIFLKDKYILDASEILKVFLQNKKSNHLWLIKDKLSSHLLSHLLNLLKIFTYRGVQMYLTNLNLQIWHISKNFVDMLDRRELLKFIGEQDGLSIRFGSDLRLILWRCAVISVPYRISEEEHGTIAVLGDLPACNIVRSYL